MTNFTEKVAIVTGGAQGIGAGIVRQMASLGVKVLVADIDMDMASRTASDIVNTGSEAKAFKVDVTSYDDLKLMINEAQNLWGRIDYLVNNAFSAGEATIGGATEVSETQWNADFSALVSSVYAGSKYAIPVMADGGGGSIVNISSVHGILVSKKALTYETGKAAVIAMTRQMAVDYGEFGIRVNSISPGHIVTERLAERWKNNPSGLKFFEDQYPVKRTGVPEDIGNATVFLCSDEASFITGHNLVVDGGLSIQLQENLAVQQAHYIKENPDTNMPYKR
ncbi:MAG: SDR family oxidoreductase [SAR202 cluster bacterium]|nr:3-ketoacyl-ACP reductase [Chloroflexota bacterium]MQG21993.1 SDR family oxidoreductase [SAR202 cluster bacterium]|tara:strand:+ start:17361 stop:18200 length:840 start_codon:yes stop_codon:yes gene_type:complete